MDDSVVHATIFQQDQPKDVLDSIYFVFERINTGGIRLSPQEIRNCVNLGPFVEMVRALNQNSSWRSVFGAVNPRAKDEELIIRFLALYVDLSRYSRPMNTFLNEFTAAMNKRTIGELQGLAAAFTETIEIVERAIGPRAFRLVRSLNAAVFDAVMVALARRLITDKSIDDAKLLAAYEGLLLDVEFKDACERATADEENVKSRISIAVLAFAGV